MISWRLIDTGPLDGAANMAVDEALLACFDHTASAPALRLYGWYPPAFSLGRFQEAGQVLDLEKCREAGIPVVRRITGGGVIYHAGELTYSLVCTPLQMPPAASVKDSFRVLAAFLLSFYQKLGLSASYAVDHYPAGMRLGERTSFCYAGRETYDILVNGRKVGGNAQRRLKHVIFQHGSIPVANSAVYGAGFLRQPPPPSSIMAGALHDFRVNSPVAELKILMAEAFSETFSVALKKETLTEEEEAAVALLVRHQQGQP